MVNNTSPTIDKLTGKSYDRVHRNDYKNCCSGGKWPYPLEVFQTVKMVLYGSKRHHKTICSTFLHHRDVLIPWCP